MKAPEGLPVKYLGGFSGHAAKGVGGGFWRLRAQPKALVVYWGTQKGSLMGTYRWSVVREEAWSDLRCLEFSSGQASRANIPAIMAFGVLGMAARREPGTLIAVSYMDGDVFFSATASPISLRTVFTRFVEETCPLARDKIIMDGEMLGRPRAPEPRTGADDSEAIAQKLLTLAELRDRGLLSGTEFEDKRRELLSRL